MAAPASAQQLLGCKMAYHMGAILDVTEKSCEAIRQVSACAESGRQCGHLTELEGFREALEHGAPEAAWKVCCFRAYEIGGYQTCSNPDPTCASAMESHVLGPARAAKLTYTLSTVRDATSAAAILPSLQDMLVRLQEARAKLGVLQTPANS